MKIIKLIFFIVLFPSFCTGAITLPWSTTFDCSEWGRQDGTLTCDGMAAGLTCENYSDLFGCPEDGCGAACELLEEQVTSSANYSNGGGGLGLLHPLCGCPTASSATSSGGGVVVTFTPTKQLWIRSYMKWAANPTWSTGHAADIKLFYLYDNTGNVQTILKWHNGVISASTQGVESDNNYLTHEWADVHGNGGNTGDGEWHYIELHVSADTTTNNGVFSAWVDGLPIQTRSDVRYGFTSAGSTGWQEIRIMSNTHYIYGPTTLYLDDLCIYGTTPPGLDADDNPYIGPIAQTYDPPTITAPADFSTTESSVEIEGTYTTDPALTVSTVTWTLGENSGLCVAALGVFSCTVPVELGANSVVFTVTDSNSGTANDSITITRTIPGEYTTRGAGYTIKGCSLK